MADVNGWLMALGFVLGLALTFAFTVRRVTREVPVAAAAKLAGSKSPSEAETTKVAAVEAGRYGVGSAKAAADGSGPAGWTIKGNEDSMLYHTPDSPAYDATIAEVWFEDEQAAEAAGFARWDSHEKD